MEQQRLADAAIADLHAALDASKRLLAAGSGEAGPELQQIYLTRTNELRSKLRDLFERRAAHGNLQGGTIVAGNDTHDLAQLQERKQELIQQVCSASEVEAELMVQLRGLLDTFGLWDAHKKHLEAPSTPAPR